MFGGREFSKSIQVPHKLNPVKVCGWDSIINFSCVGFFFLTMSFIHVLIRSDLAVISEGGCYIMDVSSSTAEPWKGKAKRRVLIHAHMFLLAEFSTLVAEIA